MIQLQHLGEGLGRFLILLAFEQELAQEPAVLGPALGVIGRGGEVGTHLRPEPDSLAQRRRRFRQRLLDLQQPRMGPLALGLEPAVLRAEGIVLGQRFLCISAPGPDSGSIP